MPELPDVTLYAEAIEHRLQAQRLDKLQIINPFLLRTIEPTVSSFEKKAFKSIQLVGKRLALQFEPDLWVVIHLMIAGRLHWFPADAKPSKRKGMLKLHFSNGILLLTEAGSKRRAALHLFSSTRQMQTIDRGGLEIFAISLAEFTQRLTRKNHTLKRALTDPAIFSGIGNAYSDEILHHARLSPIRQSQKMTQEEITTLFNSCTCILTLWTDQLRSEFGDKFPEKVTAFREGMAVHGRYREPCPVCHTRVQRIRYSNNETNYCPRCQTDNKLLADRSLSRLLKKDWPATVEELEDKIQ